MACNIVDSLSDCIDSIRAIPTELGIEDGRFYVVVETMQDVTKDWIETSRLEILPCPALNGESDVPWKTVPFGRVKDGAVSASGISLKYKREQLAPTTTDPKVRMHYEFVGGDGHATHFAASSEPYEDRANIQWTIELRTTAPSSRR